MFVTDSTAGTVTVIDGATMQTLRTVQVGNVPIDLVVDEHASLIYVANGADGTVSVIADAIQ